MLTCTCTMSCTCTCATPTGYSPESMWEQAYSSIQEVRCNTSDHFTHLHCTCIYIQVLLHCEPSVLKYTAAIHVNDTKYVDNLMREREIGLATTLTHLVLLGISLSLCGLTLSLMRIFMFG